MSYDEDAFDIVKSIPDITEAEKQYALTVYRGEGFYGLGWGNPSKKTIEDSEIFGIDPRAGVGSNNWGAIQGYGNAGAFPHVDYHANGEKYLGTFKKYSSPQDGVVDANNILLKKNVKEAVNRGSLKDAVYAQHSNGYFELNPEAYLVAVNKNYSTLTNNLGWPVLLGGGATRLPLASILQSLEQEYLSSGLPLLRVGSTGKEVNSWQCILNIKQIKAINVDGIFGPQTEIATKQYQKAFKLVPDGIVGPLTWAKVLGKE